MPILVNNLAKAYKLSNILRIMDLDYENKVIFEHLLANARFSLKDLARLLKISKPAVIKRLKFLEENGYILRYDAIINWQKLLFIKKVYFIKTSNNIKEFEKIMISQNCVFSLIFVSGLYNYQVWCFIKTKKQQLEFEKLINNLYYLDININKLIFPRVTFFDVLQQLPLPKIQDRILKISKIDVAIMKYMAQGHGRDSFYEMSKVLRLPYDSVHYHGKNIINSGYFIAIVAQPGTSKFTLQTTSLLIKCKNKESVQELYKRLQNSSHVMSDAIGKENTILVHFLSQTHVEYRDTLYKLLSLIPKEDIKDLLISHWDKVILNNRYPLEYLL